MLIENSWGNSNKNIRNHFNFIKREYKLNIMGQRRWLALRNALNPSVEQLIAICGLLATNFQK
jgi:hypothetical protein